MKKSKAYETAQPLTESTSLPVDGYVVKILDAKVEDTQWGQKLAISFDINEGDQKGFYKENYKNQTQEDKKWKGVYRVNVPADDGSDDDKYAARRLKTVMNAIEASNPGYHWDWNEEGLKDKIAGLIFQSKEYDFNGRSGFWTAPYSIKAADDIRNGNFNIPDPKLIKRTAAEQIMPGSAEEDDDIPF